MSPDPDWECIRLELARVGVVLKVLLRRVLRRDVNQGRAGHVLRPLQQVLSRFHSEEASGESGRTRGRRDRSRDGPVGTHRRHRGVNL